MTAAVGIHSHPTKKLGAKTGELASTGERVKFADHLLAAPAYPIVDAAPGISLPMDLNDTDGDCVVAGLDHFLQVVAWLLGVTRLNWTDDEIVAYYKTQNPDFDQNGTSTTNGPGSSADGGMDIATFLNYLVKQGVILGFATIDVANEAEVKAAVYLDLAIVTGETLQVAQQNQNVWDYVAGSATWGGHCTIWGGYQGTPDNFPTGTWGEWLAMTELFVSKCVSEAYFVITQWHVDNPKFRAGFDLASFGAAFTQLTGKPWTFTPTPAPVPPSPTPDLAAAVAAWFAATDVWMHGHHIGANEKAAKASIALAVAAGLVGAHEA